MTEFEDKNDSSVQPTSRTMPSFNAVFAKIFSFIAKYDRLIQTLILGFTGKQNALQTQINSLTRSFEEHRASTVERLNYLEYKDDQSERLKDENFGLKQMVASNYPDCRSLQDVWEEQYLTEQDEQ